MTKYCNSTSSKIESLKSISYSSRNVHNELYTLYQIVRVYELYVYVDGAIWRCPCSYSQHLLLQFPFLIIALTK